MSHHCCMLVDVVQIAEGCRGLKPPQTAPSTGLPAFPSEQMTVFTPLAVSVRDTNSRSLAEPPHAGCGCSPSPSRPRAKWEHATMAWDWDSGSKPSTSVPSCSTVYQHQRQTAQTTLTVWSVLPGIDLWPHWISLFLRLCLQMGWGVSCSYKLNEALATNWVYSLRTNTFSPEISSFLNLITQQLFSRPPVAPILSRPTPTCHNQSGVSRELWRGRGSSANGSLKPNLIYM